MRHALYWIVLMGIVVGAIGIGAAPRMVEELSVGGGYDDPDGGMDVDAEGNMRSNGDLLIDGQLSVGMTSSEAVLVGDASLSIGTHRNKYIAYFEFKNPSAAVNSGDSYLYLAPERAEGSNGNCDVILWGIRSQSTSGAARLRLQTPGSYTDVITLNGQTGDASITGNTTLGNASTDTITCTGRLIVRSVTDAGPMTATAGTTAEIVWNTSNSTAYFCTSGGSPATWHALW